MIRFGRIIYWFGFFIGIAFLLMNLIPLSVMLGILEGAENGQPHVGMGILTFLGCSVWGISWAVRYLTSGATSISPRARGWYEDVAPK